MRSSAFLSVLALVAGCGDPEIVVHITNDSGGMLEVFVCPTGTTGVNNCQRNYTLTKTPESVGIDVTGRTELTLAFQVKSPNFCEQLDVDLTKGTPVAIELTMTTAATSVAGCGPINACTDLVTCR
jgi:hypothetical protein